MLESFPSLGTVVQNQPGKTLGWGLLHVAIARSAPEPVLRLVAARAVWSHNGRVRALRPLSADYRP